MAKQDVRRLLDPNVVRELTAAVPGFDRAGLLGALMECWGGQEKFAADIALEFRHAAKGSMVRQRIVEMIARMISQHSSEESAVPLADLDDESLNRAIVAMLPELERISAAAPAP